MTKNRQKTFSMTHAESSCESDRLRHVRRCVHFISPTTGARVGIGSGAGWGVLDYTEATVGTKTQLRCRRIPLF